MIVSVGDLATDLVVRLGAPEIDPVSDTPATVSLHRGGAAANVAAVSARLGRAARFVGAVGADELSQAAATSLRSLSVEVCGPPARRGWSIVVLVDPDGTRRFLTDTGDVDEWPAPDPGWLDGATRLHLSAYALCNERSADACEALASLAVERGVARSIDVCSASVVRAWGVDRFAEMLQRVRPDVVKANADEYDLLGHDAIPWAWYVVTNGADSTLVFDPDRRGPLVVPVPASEVVDSTGAGDAFVAGFLHAWDAHADPAAATAAGHAASEQVIAGPGADYWKADLRAES